MINKTISIVMLLYFSNTIIAQEIPTSNPSPISYEVLVGTKQQFFQIIAKKPFIENGNSGFFSATSFIENSPKDVSKNEFISFTSFYHNIHKGFGLNTGASYSSLEGLMPNVGLHYMHNSKRLSLLVMPTYTYDNAQRLSLMLISEHKTKLSEKLNLYSRIQAFYSYDLNPQSHFRSFAYARLGLSFSRYTIGIGQNNDWYGPKKNIKKNVGLFVKFTI